MEPHTGALFVVHGKIDSLVHDAAIVPVDRARRYNRVWRGLVGEKPAIPDDWEARGWGRVHNAPDRVWAVSIGGDPPDDYDLILDRIDSVLARVRERGEHRQPVRGVETLPLVAVPVVGIGRGGFSRQRGRVVGELVQRLHRTSRELGVDVALVTPDPAVYAAAQYARRDLDFGALPEDLEREAKALGRSALNHDLALFLGAGVGIPAGLPTWKGLISRLAADLGVRELGGEVTDLNVTDQAELIHMKDPKGFQQRVASIVREVARPSLLHALLASLDCHEVVTTNYDLLYEGSVAATDRAIESVMPWSSAHRSGRWVLKLHGDVDHPKQIVLTRRHMVQYDAANRPSASMLQSLLLTKRLLMVGVSMTDDNVIRLAHEVEDYRRVHQGGGHGTFATVLDTAGDSVRKRLWEGQLDWITLHGAGGLIGPRVVELFLDRVAFHAARDSSWLLDERFEGLLENQDDRELARRVRELYADLPRREGTKWTPLVQSLRRMGAAGEG